jgi:hypothetical protein
MRRKAKKLISVLLSGGEQILERLISHFRDSEHVYSLTLIDNLDKRGRGAFFFGSRVLYKPKMRESL